MTSIHPTAIVDASAQLGSDVAIGPFCLVEDGVRIGDGCRLAARAVIKSGTTLGDGNEVGEGAILGGKPQHLRCSEDLGELRLGCHNVIRENVTMHRSLAAGGATDIGDRNLFMVNAHVAHDCQIGNQVILVNNTLLAGHVVVGDRAFLSGAAAVHQFCRVGRLAMIGGQSRVTQDVPPFVTVDGKTGRVVGLNRIGLQRAGCTPEEIRQLKAAYRLVYRSGLSWAARLAALGEQFPGGLAAEFQPFLASCERGIVQERRAPAPATLSFPRIAAAAADELATRKAG